MDFIVQRYLQNPLYVDAVQVTEKNMEAVAKWCNGMFIQAVQGPRAHSAHVNVTVFKPTSTRQTKAYVGDWVLRSAAGFKVYAQKSFGKAFSLAIEVCGDTDATVDNKPCVFGKGHRVAEVPTVCRSIEDYKVFVQRMHDKENALDANRNY